MLQHDEGFFAAIHREHRPRVFNYIHRRVNSREAADELTNDVFRVAWQRNPDPADLTIAWLLAVAHHLIGNEYRRRERSEQLMQRIRSTAVLQSRTAQSAQQHTVAEALLGLRDREREILLLAYWDDLSLADIAQVLACSPSAAKVRLHRARKAFAAQLPTALMAEGVA
ncbi:sigma-70 family RNA polymerase sigma factor [Arthrobacter sp. Bz4]|uniref:RNA polymerase sigma factor n=1 Tax=Arthrobacter sp. Bz4 TaxID=2171979 RepID=UPI000D5159CB|nr:sigma-70 family RNA polymerase sigma factor [Arthrobacter sp. Bz4]PVE15369.1 sigma-70 family RNA polymerase sigma factor [Arthrobacter sp. Bz4]